MIISHSLVFIAKLQSTTQVGQLIQYNQQIASFPVIDKNLFNSPQSIQQLSLSEIRFNFF